MLRRYRHTVYENALRRRNGGGGPAPFSPSSITGLSLWLDAADSSTMTFSTGSNVTQWRDKSGSGNNSIANGTITYTAPGMSFPSSWLVGQFTSAYTGSNVHVFSVTNINSATTSTFTPRILSLGKSGTADFNNPQSTYLGKTFSAQSVEVRRNGTNTALALPSYNTSHILQEIHINTSQNITVNATTSASGTSIGGAFDITHYAIGNALSSYPEGVSQYMSLFNGTISETLVYFGSALTTPQVQQVEGYLAWKWGLQANLPAGHPYKLAPP